MSTYELVLIILGLGVIFILGSQGLFRTLHTLVRGVLYIGFAAFIAWIIFENRYDLFSEFYNWFQDLIDENLGKDNE